MTKIGLGRTHASPAFADGNEPSQLGAESVTIMPITPPDVAHLVDDDRVSRGFREAVGQENGPLRFIAESQESMMRVDRASPDDVGGKSAVKVLQERQLHLTA